jgi:hypothetical protein
VCVTVTPTKTLQMSLRTVVQQSARTLPCSAAIEANVESLTNMLGETATRHRHSGGHVLSEGAWSTPQTLSPSSEAATDAVYDLPRARQRIPHKAFTRVGVPVQGLHLRFRGGLELVRFWCVKAG